MHIGVLDEWAEHDWSDGIQIDELSELDALSVRTHNTTYEIVVTSPATGDVLVRGGARFPTFTAARLLGSTNGGNLVKRSGIYPGLRLELQRTGRRIITSTIVSVDFAPQGSEH